MVLSWNLQNILETPSPSFISKKPGEIPIFGTFFGEHSILPYISLKIGFFRSAMFENVIVTSYVGRFSKFWYQWKGETHPYTMVPHTHTLGMSISSSWGGGNHPPLGRCVTENTLGRRGLKGIAFNWWSLMTYKDEVRRKRERYNWAINRP